MRAGEGARGTSVEVTSPDPLDDMFVPWQDQKLDGDDVDAALSPASSRYSSCGESEFEKYCSANSVMGTPSLCGSAATFQDFHDSEFGSFKSFRLGDENALDNLKSDLRLEGSRSLSLRADAYSQKNVSFGANGGLGKRNDTGLGKMENGLISLELEGISDINIETFGSDEGGFSSSGDWKSLAMMQCSSMNESTTGRGNGEAIKEHVSKMLVGKDEISHSRLGIEQVNRGFEGLNLQLGFGSEGCSDEGTSSRLLDHSEGEDSMYGCGTDDEKEIGLSNRGYGQYSQEANAKNENPLLMTSTIAFGSDDWNDFMDETKESPFTPLEQNDLQGQKQQKTETVRDSLKSICVTTSTFHGLDVAEKHDMRVNRESNQVEEARTVAASSKTPGDPTNASEFAEEDQVETMKAMFVTTNKVESNILNTVDGLVIEETHLTDGFNITDNGLGMRHHYTSTKDFAGSEDCEETFSPVDPLSSSTDNHISYSPEKEAAEKRIGQIIEGHQSHSVQASGGINMKTKLKVPPTSLSITVDNTRQIKTESVELNSFYNEIVNDMEEVLMDSRESPGARFTQGKAMHHLQVPSPLRDGGSTASTSSMHDITPLGRHPLKIDGVEVIGARQKKGDVSLGERLVGVKEYTVYKIRVWSGDDCWEVERRYRDFFTLYRRLKTSFSDQGWILPSPWSSVGPESRKFFGNASPVVVAERSVLIQECLQSLLHSRFSLSQLSSLIWFLSPNDGFNSPASDRDVPHSPNSTVGTNTSAYTLGQSISLIVEIRPAKSMGQMLEAQHYSCAGCHKHFDDGKTRMWELVQTLGWGKPRLCMYSGQLFCLSCHTNETAVLPARVLHFWDFTEYPVSQLAKSYLDSIHDQPMLCVSAVNPFLFSKVPALQHVTNVRKRIGGMLPYVRCPFRRSIYKGLGSRRYILESIDFFALRDLIDLSKGVFAALPVMVETVSRKITEHITDQCLICYDVGVPCSARQACDDPPSLIFPFQEGEVERCKSCGLVFHRPCFKRTSSCPCGVLLGPAVKGNPGVGNEVVPSLNFMDKKVESKSTVGFFSELFSKAVPERLWQRGENDTVILMGSLPSTSL